jgi:hypothetical protein
MPVIGGKSPVFGGKSVVASVQRHALSKGKKDPVAKIWESD